MLDDLWFGKYEVVRTLGEGATSKVYLATHVGLGQKRVIKCISKSLISLDEARRETHLLINIRSDAIPIVYDVEEDENYLYIIEEYMQGETLLSYRLRSHYLSEAFILRLSMQICELIKYLHSMQFPILYLDLKPSNLCINKEQIKLIDFGAARFKEGPKLRCNYGSKGYAAPEQYFSADLDEECDIYGIGMLMYFLITGNVNVSKGDLANIRNVKGYSKELKNLVARSIKHNPCQRYANVQSLEKKLSRLYRGQNKKGDMTSSSKKIALIGSQHHVGVTHLAFYLLTYLAKNGLRAIYIECSPSNVVMSLVHSDTNCQKGYILYNNCRITKLEWLSEADLKEYDYVIYDYGCMCESRLIPFLQAEKRIVVLGGRQWEKSCTKQALSYFRKEKDISYVMNHLTAKEFYNEARKMKGITLYRMPLECNAFSRNSKIVDQFVNLLLE